MKLEKYLIGLDLGTSAIKGIIMSADGQIKSCEKERTEYSYPLRGHVEFDADRFYSLAARLIKKLADVIPDKNSIVGISMASASGNTVLLDSEMKPLTPCISWLDERTTWEIEEVLGNRNKSEVYKVIGWPLSKRFPLAHLSWLRYHKPELLSNANKVCMSTDYLNYRLTGRLGIDNSTVTTFFLRNQCSGMWHMPFLKSLDLPQSRLPEVYPTGSILGHITQKAAKDTGLQTGMPVILGAFDHPCAARGAGVMKEGQMLISCGTSWVGFYPVQERQKITSISMLADPYMSPDGPWGAMFSLPAIAASVERYICKYISNRKDRYQEFDKLSSCAEPCPKGLFINPMSKNEPDNISNFSKAEIARALMEGTAFLFRTRIQKCADAGIKASSAVMVGGPSETEPWPQILCNILGFQVASINGSCAGAVGAAILAGIGIGLYKNEDDAFKILKFSRKFYKPDNEIHSLYDKAYYKFVEYYG